MVHTSFEVHGPFSIPTEQVGVGWKVRTGCPDFWKDPSARKLAGRRGCYVFGMRAAKGIRLSYVGRTTRQTFDKECFTIHKTGEHYNPALNAVEKGTPVLFLIAAPKTKGKPNGRRIADLEDFLIQTATGNGTELTNIRGIDAKSWGIAGVVRSGQGKPSKPAAALKKALKL